MPESGLRRHKRNKTGDLVQNDSESNKSRDSLSESDKKPSSSGRRSFFSSLLESPSENQSQNGKDHASSRRPPLKWRAVFLGAGVMLLGSMLLQLALAPLASRSKIVEFTSQDASARVLASGGRGPTALVIPAPGGVVWTGNGLADEIAFHDLTNTALQGTIRVGKAPVALAHDPVTGNLIVANSGSNDVSFVNPESHLVTATIGAGENPAGVAVATSQRRAYIANIKSGDVSLIDLDGRIILARIPVGKEPQALAVVGPEELPFVAVTGENEIKAIDPALGAITATIKTDSAALDLAETTTGMLAAALFQNKQIIIIDTDTMSVVKTIPLDMRPTRLAVNPKTGEMAVISAQSRSAHVIEPESGNLIASVDLGVEPAAIAADPESSAFLVFGATPIPALINLGYIVLILGLVGVGGFVAGLIAKTEPIRHAVFALGMLAFVIWLVLAGGRIEALLAVAFSAAFAIPAAALGGFMAGRRTGTIEIPLLKWITTAFTPGKRPIGKDSNTVATDAHIDEGQLSNNDEPEPGRRRRHRSRRFVEASSPDEPLD